MVLEVAINVAKAVTKTASMVAKSVASAVKAVVSTAAHIARNMGYYISTGINAVRQLVFSGRLLRFVKSIFNGFYRGLRFGIELGFELIKLSFRGLKYIATHIPEILRAVGNGLVSVAKGFYRVCRYIANNCGEIARFMFNRIKDLVINLPTVIQKIYNFMKVILTAIARSIVNNLTEIATNFGRVCRWLYHNGLSAAAKLCQRLLNATAKIIGFGLGLILAPFQILYELGKMVRESLFGEPQAPAPQPESAPCPSPRLRNRDDVELPLSDSLSYAFDMHVRRSDEVSNRLARADSQENLSRPTLH